MWVESATSMTVWRGARSPSKQKGSSSPHPSPRSGGRHAGVLRPWTISAQITNTSNAMINSDQNG